MDKKMTRHDVLATHEAARLGVHRTVLVAAIRDGACEGECVDGYWWTNSRAAAEWYAQHYRHAGQLYSQTAGKRWSPAELAQLADAVEAGADLAKLAQRLGRSHASVKSKASKLRREEASPRAEAEVRAAREKAALIQKAKAALAEDRQGPEDWYQKRRRTEREGRLRLHVHPEVKRLLYEAAREAGLTLALFVTRAGLAAREDPAILRRGEILAKKIDRD